MADDRTAEYFQKYGAPSREEFNRAAKEVMESAPPGLSRDDFYKAVEGRISNNRPTPRPTLKGFASNLAGNAVEMPGQVIQGILHMFSQDPGKTVTDIGAGLREKAKGYYNDPLGTIYNKPADFLADVATVGQGARLGSILAKAPGKMRAAAQMRKVSPGMANKSGYVRGAEMGESALPFESGGSFDTDTGNYIPAAAHDAEKFNTTIRREDLVSPLHDDPALVAPGEEAAYNATRDVPKFRNADDVAYEGLMKRLNMGQEMPEPHEPTPASHGPHPQRPIELGPSPAENARRLESSPWAADEDWHSGAEPGSAEARNAHGMHRYQGEMDAGYARRIADERGSVPTGLFMTLAKLGLMKGVGLPGAVARGAIKSAPYVAEPAIDTGLISRIVNK